MNYFYRKITKMRYPFLFLACYYSLSLAQGPDTLWTKTYGGSDWDVGYSVQQTSDGGYIIVGTTAFFGHGEHDVWLLKTDSNGDTLWTKTYGGTDNDGGHSVQQTTDGGYIISGYTHSFSANYGDAYLIKTNSLGDALWTKTYGADFTEYRSSSVQQTLDGGYITAGWIREFGTFNGWGFLIKTDALGDTIWTRNLSGSVQEVQQTSDGGYISVGCYWDPPLNFWLQYQKTDSIGNTIWNKTFFWYGTSDGQSVQQTPEGGYIITGSLNDHVWLLRTDANGDTLWTKILGDQFSYGMSVQQISSNGYIITGFTGSDPFDLYIIRTDSHGDTLWTRTYGGAGPDEGLSIQQTSDGGYIIAGFTDSFGAGNGDLWILKIAPDTFSITENQITNLPLFNLKVYPNPFRQMTDIRCETTEQVVSRQESVVSIKIYDVSGRLVKSFSRITPYTLFPTVVTWHGNDDSGRPVPEGVYFIELNTEENSIVEKVIFLK